MLMSGYSSVRLLIAILCTGALSAASPAGSGATATRSDTTVATSSPGHKVLIYYLYFEPRCEWCINMEKYSKEAVETGFASALHEGSVQWHAYNMDSTEHSHFWNDFQLDTKSLVMVDMLDGKSIRWKNCKKIWDLVENKPDFIRYVQSEVREYVQNISH